MGRVKIKWEKVKELPTANDFLDKEYGTEGTPERTELKAKAMAFYYGELIREKRKEQKLTQQELAEKTGLNRPYIAKVEKGQTDVQLSSFIRVLQGLGLSLSIK